MVKSGAWEIPKKSIEEDNSLGGLKNKLAGKDLKDFEKPKKNTPPIKKEAPPVKGSTKLASKFDEALSKSHNQVQDWPEIDEIADILKEEKINQVVIHAKENREPEDEKAGLTFKPDLDSRLALYIINDFNKKPPEEIYTEGAVTSLVIKGGNEKNLKEKRDGLVLWVDVGGKWLQIEKDKKNLKNKKIFIDHHGKAKNLQTSSAKMVYEIMRRAGQLKENRKWMENLVEMVTDTDNLLYLGERDKEGKKTFTREFFLNEWPRTIKAIAEEIPFKTLVDLFKSGKITDPSKIFTDEELKGEIGKLEWAENWKEKGRDGKWIQRTTKTIADLCREKEVGAKETIMAIEKDIENARFLNLKTLGTKLGDVIYHDFHKIGKDKRGNVINNKIPFKLAYMGTRAMGYDTFILWNEERRDFFINTKHPNLGGIVKNLEKAAPGTANVRSAMVFAPKDKNAFKNLTERKFLDIIDYRIAEDSRLGKAPVKNVPDKKVEDLQRKAEKNIPETNEVINKEIEELKKERDIVKSEAEDMLKLIAEIEKKIEAFKEGKN